jgi:quinol monooxygenase YgiN
MLIVHVQVHVKPEHIEAFKLATIENAGNSVKEPGIARFDVVQQAGDPSRFVLVEAYRDAEATTRHKATTHYQVWAEKVAEMLAEPRSREVYTNIYPADQDW